MNTLTLSAPKESIGAKITAKWKAVDKIKVAMIAVAVLVAAAMIINPAFAEGSRKGNVDGDLQDIILQFANLIGSVARGVGILLGVFGAFQLALAFKNDDADSKSKAGMFLLAAIICIMIKPIVNNLDLFSKGKDSITGARLILMSKFIH